jgi:hypothetical protein
VERGVRAAVVAATIPHEGKRNVTSDPKLDASIPDGAMSGPPDRELEKELKKHPEDSGLKVDVGSDESMDASDPSAAVQPGCEGHDEPVPSSGFPE